MVKHVKNPVLEPIAATLKVARARKGLSQRTLSEKIGAPQSHISKIENAEVDLQTSSLIEMARALDLELALIPRSLLPAIRALQHSPQTPLARAASQSLQDLLQRLAKQAAIEPFHSRVKALRILTETLADLRHRTFEPAETDQLYSLLERVNRELEQLHAMRARSGAPRVSKEQILSIDRAVRELRALRNAITHGAFPTSSPRPAYRLDEENSDG